jgi:hypothetical protein
MMPDERIGQLLGTPQPMNVLAKALIDGANQAGGKDNITVVLVRVGQFDPATAAQDDEESETIMASELPHQETAGVLAGVAAGPSEDTDTPITYEGDTPSTDNPTPNRC